jgi:anaerobic magnesium-protoporphyrin IX monomethyl ester cyclase
MMDILLSHGYFLELDPIEKKVMRPYPPLGLLYLSAWLKRAGRDVRVFDSTFALPEQLIDTLRETRPRVLGLYANLMTRPRIVNLMARARELGIPVIVGGPDASGNAEQYLTSGATVVVRGEGEVTLTELLDRWTGENPADRHRGHERAHWRRHHPRARPRPDPLARGSPVAGSRGHCPRAVPERVAHASRLRLCLVDHCARLSVLVSLVLARAVYGDSHRRRPVDDVIAEIEFIQKRYAPEKLWFVDDVFTIHKGWITEFARKMKAKGIRIPFECISRAERIDDAVAQALVDLGCFRVWIGSESGSQKILDAMDRRVKVETVQARPHMIRARGIEVGFFIMVGYEGEEDQDIVATVDHIRKSEPDIVLTTTSYPDPWDELREGRRRSRGEHKTVGDCFRSRDHHPRTSLAAVLPRGARVDRERRRSASDVARGPAASRPQARTQVFGGAGDHAPARGRTGRLTDLPTGGLLAPRLEGVEFAAERDRGHDGMDRHRHGNRDDQRTRSEPQGHRHGHDPDEGPQDGPGKGDGDVARDHARRDPEKDDFGREIAEGRSGRAEARDQEHRDPEADDHTHDGEARGQACALGRDEGVVEPGVEEADREGRREDAEHGRRVDEARSEYRQDFRGSQAKAHGGGKASPGEQIHRSLGGSRPPLSRSRFPGECGQGAGRKGRGQGEDRLHDAQPSCKQPEARRHPQRAENEDLDPDGEPAEEAVEA